MTLMIRLRQQGRVNKRVFRLVVIEKRSPRDGRYIENLGWYNPFLEKDNEIKADRILHWLNKGAVLTEKARSLVKRADPVMLKEFEGKKNKCK